MCVRHPSAYIVYLLSAIVSSVAGHVGLSRANILNPLSHNPAVKPALAPTHVIQGTKAFSRVTVSYWPRCLLRRVFHGAIPRLLSGTYPTALPRSKSANYSIRMMNFDEFSCFQLGRWPYSNSLSQQMAGRHSRPWLIEDSGTPSFTWRRDFRVCSSRTVKKKLGHPLSPLPR